MDNKIEQLTEWLTSVIRGIVSHPDGVEVAGNEDDQGLFFKVKVHEEDRGQAIGKKGQNAQAIRILLRSAGGMRDFRASMMVDVPDSKFSPEREIKVEEK